MDHKLWTMGMVYMIFPLGFHIRLKDNGTIVEIGSHEELLKKKGAYYSLINTQL